MLGAQNPSLYTSPEHDLSLSKILHQQVRAPQRPAPAPRRWRLLRVFPSGSSAAALPHGAAAAGPVPSKNIFIPFSLLLHTYARYFIRISFVSFRVTVRAVLRLVKFSSQTSPTQNLIIGINMSVDLPVCPSPLLIKSMTVLRACITRQLK